MGKVEEVQGARVLIVWDGKKLDVRSNCPPHVGLLMAVSAQRLLTDQFLKSTPQLPDWARKVGEGS